MTDTPARQPQHTFKCTDCKDINFTCTLTNEDGESRPTKCPYTIIEGKTPWKKVRKATHTSPPEPDYAHFEDMLLKELEYVRQSDGDDNDRVPFDAILKAVETRLKTLKFGHPENAIYSMGDMLKAAKAARERVLEKMVNILAAHTINSDDFAKDGIKSGWILVGGYEPIIDEIDSLRAQQELI